MNDVEERGIREVFPEVFPRTGIGGTKTRVPIIGDYQGRGDEKVSAQLKTARGHQYHALQST
jgi:hypothetical protein